MLVRLTKQKMLTTKHAVLSTGFMSSLLWFMAISHASDSLPPPIKLYYENRAPYMEINNGELAGAEGLLASAALKSAGITVNLSEAPVARQTALISNNTEPACAVGLYWTAERARMGKYSLPLTHSQPQSIVIRANNTKVTTTDRLVDLLANPSFSLILRNGYSYGADVDAILKEAKATILRPYDNSLERIRQVQLGIVDGAMFTPFEAEYLIKQLGPQGNDLIVKQFKDAPDGKPRHLYCSKMVDDSLIKKINEALRKGG